MKHILLVSILFAAQTATAEGVQLPQDQSARTTTKIQEQINQMKNDAFSDQTIDCKSAAVSQISETLHAGRYGLSFDKSSTSPRFIAAGEMPNAKVEIFTNEAADKVVRAVYTRYVDKLTDGPLESTKTV
ncbi:MAG: hypothetical protein V4692_06320, partial [Bdellovibrionota bacterium]